MRPFNTIDVTNTVGQFVDAFNNNALASADHTWYLGELFFNGMLYTGLETIGGEKIHSLTNINISAKSPQNLEIDNFYLYFRKSNKIVLVDGITVDLDSYNDDKPYYVYINATLGYRVSQRFQQEDDEVRLFRFRIGTDGLFKECYVLAQRFGTSTYDAGQEFYNITGLAPRGVDNLGLVLSQGYIQRSGIRFDNHNLPDILTIAETLNPYKIRYNTANNIIDYTQASGLVIDSTKIIDYANNSMSDVEADQFSVQRIMYDVYANELIIQYGTAAYSTMALALSSLENTEIPFPYNEVGFYLPVGLMFIKSGATTTTNPEECIVIAQTSIDTHLGTSYFFAEDAYARGQLDAIQNQLDKLSSDVLSATGTLNAHISNTANPHTVTKAQVNLGNVDDFSYDQIVEKLKTDLADTFVKKSGDTMTGRLSVPLFRLNNRDFYLGETPIDAEDNSYAIK